VERDAPLFKEEVVEVFVDPVGDLESYFEIEVNPLNTVMDLVLRRGRVGVKRNFAWRCEELETAVRWHFADGSCCRAGVESLPGANLEWSSNEQKGLSEAVAWSAELAIPFGSLGAVSLPSEWRANFYRIDRPGGLGSGEGRELSAWSPTGAPNFHVPEKFGMLRLS
jgi:hypothetical protein